jgi:cell division protein FtsI/penicillin-binding protein 2
LGPITGYTHPVYGQAGLEASLDDYLRGLKGNPSSLIWWDHLLYGTPPPGDNVRLSLDLFLQSKTDELLGTHTGAIILMNAQTGEILAIASHPGFDPNKLDEDGSALTSDPASPLLNRATQGQYPLGTILQPLVTAQFKQTKPVDSDLLEFYKKIGLLRLPLLNMPVAPVVEPGTTAEIRMSPLQVILAAAAISNHGKIPSPRIAMAVDTPEQGWVVLPASNQPVEALQPKLADEAASSFITGQKPYWSNVAKASEHDSVISWCISGTLPDWQGSPLVVVVTIEEDNAALAANIGQQILMEASKH